MSAGMYYISHSLSVSDSPQLCLWSLCVLRVGGRLSVVCLSVTPDFPSLSHNSQAIQPLSQWKNAGHGASQPGRQLGSPSVALKTCYPPECICLA